MTEDNKDMKLGLPLGYPNPSVRTRMKTSSGAGVNADSRIDPTLVEHRTENVASCPWDTGPSNMTLACDDKSIGDRKVTKLQAELTVNSEVGPLLGSSHARHSGMSGDRLDTNPVVEERAVYFNKKQECNHEEKAFCCQNDIQSEDVATRSKTDTGQQDKNTVDALPLLEYKTKDITSSRIEDVPSGDQMLDMKAHGSENAPIEGLEESAENEVQHVIENNACGQSEKGSRVEISYPIEVFGTLEKNKIKMLQGKGKKITLFGKNITENITKSEDDSHDSVESSNSATLSLKGKKRGNFENQLVVGSKRIKSLQQEAPTLTSPIKPGSSFLNWISNMVKGLPKANQDECPIALGLGHPSYGLDCYDQQNQACNKIQDPGSGSGHMGFQSMFRSLYCPKTIETERTDDDPTVSGAKESMESQKSFINVMPISFYRENDESCNKFLDNTNSDHHTSGGNGGDLSIQTSSQPRILCANNDSTPESSKAKSIEKMNLTRLTCSNKKALRSTHTWLDKQKSANFEDKSLHIPAEGQVMPNIIPKSDLSRNLWITRFSSRTPTPPLDLDHWNSSQIKSEDSSGLIKHIPQNHVNSTSGQKKSESAESVAHNTKNAVGKVKLVETSIGFNRVVEHSHGKPLCRINSPPPSFKSLEPMASAFARRLEVLKSIPSVTQNDPIPFKITCLYCGKNGHGLVSCPEVQKYELVDLMRNISSHDAVEGSTHWCIKCLQLGHLAISCSVSTSSRQQQSNKNAPIHNYRTANIQLYKSGEPYSSMLFTKESHCKVPSDNSSYSGKVCKISGSERRVSCHNDVQNNNLSCYKELKVKETQVTPECKSASKPISCDALNIFEAIRRLRLSRMHILQWMNSNRSLVHLNGFFLRLRLRKWETKLGGTGYYVACINESHRKMMLESSERSIFVSVGNIRCSVESQYISNHDFSEDEFMTWWHAILKNGEIPTLDDLRWKFEEKQKLGL